MHKQSLIRDFTSGGVAKQMVAFSLPLFFSNLLQAVYNMVDMVVIGQFVGRIGLSAVSVGGDVLNLLSFLAMGFAGAGQVLISQLIGAGRREDLGRMIGTMFSFLLLCAVGMSALCLLLREQILCWLNTPAEALAYAREYATTCMLGLVFIYGYNTVSAILRGMGDSKRPFLFIALAAVVNLALDLWFIAGLNLGAFGAALATVIGQGLSFLLAIAYLYRKRALFGFDFRLRSFAIDRHMAASLVKLGVPMAIKSASIQFSKLFVNAWINSYGVVVSAVTGVAHKINSISNLFANSVNTAGSSMVGQNIGAQKYGRVSRIIGVAFAINGVCSSLLALCMLVFPRQVFGLFTSDAEVLEVCMQFIPVALVIFAGSALRSPMNAFINGCGNYRLNFAVALLDGIVARISLALLLGLVGGLGYLGFWYGDALAGFTPFVIGAVYYLSGRWKRRKAILQPDGESEPTQAQA